jgi:endonuclease/exonuclease/phosphatase family metal-dependent hydrolase
MSARSLTVATWNMEWKRAGSAAATTMFERLSAVSPDVLCLTEAYEDVLPTGEGHAIVSGADYGYTPVAGRRKVLLWSREPWAAVDTVGDPALPSGRFVAGRTSTALGFVTVVGVCIPWRDAHVRTGRKERQPWQDHQQYLAGLADVLSRVEGPAIVLGDFNQKVPRSCAPAPVFADLDLALGGRFAIATAGPLAPDGQAAIDHIALSPELAAREVRTLSNKGDDGRWLSDHFGLAAQITVADAAAPEAATDCDPSDGENRSVGWA